MTNMFSGKSIKQIPKSLAECHQPDATATNLHFWAERLERWGQRLFIVLIIAGIISTVLDTMAMIDVNDDMVLSVFITSAITWALYAFIEYCTYHVLALLISALASITQSTIISANVALYEAAKNDPTPAPVRSSVSHRPVSGTDSTDSTKDDVFVWHPVPETTAYIKGQTNIQCANCRRVQFRGNKSCIQCGAFFSRLDQQ